jgi:hypothetical protein
MVHTVQGITLRIVATALLLAPLALYVFVTPVESARNDAPVFIVVYFVAFAAIAYLLTRWLSRWWCLLILPGMFATAFGIEVLFVIYTGNGDPLVFNSARFIAAVLGTSFGALWSKYSSTTAVQAETPSL